MKFRLLPTTKRNEPNIELKIRVKTPHGLAKNIEKKWGFMLRTFILGKNVPHIKTKVSASEMVWVVITNIKGMININKRLSLYESMVKGVFGSKLLKKGIAKYFTKDQQAEVYDMLVNHTKIEIIDPSTQ